MTVSCSQKKAAEETSKRKQSVKPVRKNPEMKETMKKLGISLEEQLGSKWTFQMEI